MAVSQNEGSPSHHGFRYWVMVWRLGLVWGSHTLGTLGNLQKQHEETYTQQLQYRKMHFFELLWTSFPPTNDTNKCLQDASEKLKCHRKCITYHPDPRCADSRACPKPSTRAVKLFVGVEWVKFKDVCEEVPLKEFHKLRKHPRKHQNKNVSLRYVKIATCSPVFIRCALFIVHGISTS